MDVVFVTSILVRGCSSVLLEFTKRHFDGWLFLITLLVRETEHFRFVRLAASQPCHRRDATYRACDSVSRNVLSLGFLIAHWIAVNIASSSPLDEAHEWAHWAGAGGRCGCSIRLNYLIVSFRFVCRSPVVIFLDKKTLLTVHYNVFILF